MCFIIIYVLRLGAFPTILLEEFVNHLGEEDGVKNQQYEIVHHKGDHPRCHRIPAHYGIDNSEEQQHQEHTEAGTCRMERGEEVEVLRGNPLPKHRQCN